MVVEEIPRDAREDHTDALTAPHGIFILQSNSPGDITNRRYLQALEHIHVDIRVRRG